MFQRQGAATEIKTLPSVPASQASGWRKVYEPEILEDMVLQNVKISLLEVQALFYYLSQASIVHLYFINVMFEQIVKEMAMSYLLMI